MRRRLYTQQKNTRIPTPEPSTAPAGGMFQPRSFGKPSSTADAYQQPDLKTSLVQAQRYGHHLSQMHDTDVSPPQVTQPKMGMGRSMHSEPAAQLKSGSVQPSSGGRPLPKNVQQKMEAAFSSDFSHVRVHEGTQAEAIGADAYAQGNQVHFQPGKYNPTSQSGQQLLGHELTHVVQQRTGKVAVPQGKGAPINSDPKLEQEADILGAKAAQGEQVQVAGAASGIQRQATSPLGHNFAPVQLSGRGRGRRRSRSPAGRSSSPAPASGATSPAPASGATSPAPASGATSPAPASGAKQYNPPPNSLLAPGEVPKAKPTIGKPKDDPIAQTGATSHAPASGAEQSLKSLLARGEAPKAKPKDDPTSLSAEQEAAALRASRIWRGRAVRKEVRVETAAPGIVHTRIHRPKEEIQSGERPGEIMKHMAVGDTYDRLRVHQGAGNGGVAVEPFGNTQSPQRFADQVSPNTAVVNGGFFSLPNSKPVGPTKDRKNVEPIPNEYRNDYGAVNVNGKVGISSGPMLEPSKGDNMFEHDRFKYKIPDPSTGEPKKNPLNSRPGALTHAGDRNPRAAISTFPPTKEMPGNAEAPGDAIMHTLTSGGKRDPRKHGATMEEWQNITTQGSYQHSNKKGESQEMATRPSTLNLDGGGSVCMGITTGDYKLHTIASGSQSGESQRPIPNMLYAGSKNRKAGEISVGELPNEERQKKRGGFIIG